MYACKSCEVPGRLCLRAVEGNIIVLPLPRELWPKGDHGYGAPMLDSRDERFYLYPSSISLLAQGMIWNSTAATALNSQAKLIK